MASSLWIVFLIFSLAYSEKACDFADTIPDSVFAALLQTISAQGLSSERIKVLSSFAVDNTLGFNSNQTVQLLKLFPFSDDRILAINTVTNFLLTLDVPGVISLVRSVSLSSDKMIVLKTVIDLTSEAELKVAGAVEKILAEFSFSSDKAKAKQIIENANPRSCLFGPANIPLFAFIIDVSGSMSEKFKDEDGTVYTRLGYVQRDLLKVMNSTLKSTQQFNIISFSSSARGWQPGVVPVNPQNIASAGSFVRALVANGGTNMLPALKLAFSDPKVLGVYFLSDGDPSDNPAAIISFAVATKKPVHTIAFKAPPSGANFLFQLANSTHGSFRNIV